MVLEISFEMLEDRDICSIAEKISFSSLLTCPDPQLEVGIIVYNVTNIYNLFVPVF